jgi:hypothetical protein
MIPTRNFVPVASSGLSLIPYGVNGGQPGRQPVLLDCDLDALDYRSNDGPTVIVVVVVNASRVATFLRHRPLFSFSFVIIVALLLVLVLVLVLVLLVLALTVRVSLGEPKVLVLVMLASPSQPGRGLAAWLKYGTSRPVLGPGRSE